MSSKIALSYGKTGRTKAEDVGMIKTSRCRVKWREVCFPPETYMYCVCVCVCMYVCWCACSIIYFSGVRCAHISHGSSQGAHNAEDRWVVISLYFYDVNNKLIVPKKAISSGGRGTLNSHDLAIFVPKDSQAIYHYPHEWDGRRAGIDLFLGAVFNQNTRICSIRIIHNHEPVGAMGEPKTLAVEYWDSKKWVEYADDKWRPELIYSNGISAFQEKRERENSLYLQINLDANQLLRDTVEPNESKSEYLVDTDKLKPTDKWRVSCVDNSDWTWDVKKLKFIDDDGNVIYPLRAIKSGNYNSYYSANGAISDKPFSYCWGGKMDPETRTFFIGGQFRKPVLLCGIEVVQPFGEHRRNALFVEYWDMEKEVWYKIGRFDFFDSLIKRGPVSLCVLSSEPIEISSGDDNKYRIGDDPELDTVALLLDDFKKEVNEAFPDDEPEQNHDDNNYYDEKVEEVD